MHSLYTLDDTTVHVIPDIMHRNSTANARKSASGRTTERERNESDEELARDSDEDALFQQLSDDEGNFPSIDSAEDHDRPASAGTKSFDRSFDRDERIEGWNSDGDEEILSRSSNQVAQVPKIVKRGSKIVVCKL